MYQGESGPSMEFGPGTIIFMSLFYLGVVMCLHTVSKMHQQQQESL